MGRNAKSIQEAKDKAAYVADVLKAEPDLTMNAVADRIKAKFGSRLVHAKLKEAFVGAGGKLRRLRRTKKAADGEKVASKGVRKAANAAKKAKGRRRRTGRRSADKAAARLAGKLGAMGSHLVVVSTDSKPLVRDFDSEGAMTNFVAQQLAVGTPLPMIACYIRQPLAVEFEV